VTDAHSAASSSLRDQVASRQDARYFGSPPLCREPKDACADGAVGCAGPPWRVAMARERAARRRRCRTATGCRAGHILESCQCAETSLAPKAKNASSHARTSTSHTASPPTPRGVAREITAHSIARPERQCMIRSSTAPKAPACAPASRVLGLGTDPRHFRGRGRPRTDDEHTGLIRSIATVPGVTAVRAYGA